MNKTEIQPSRKDLDEVKELKEKLLGYCKQYMDALSLPELKQLVVELENKEEAMLRERLGNSRLLRTFKLEGLRDLYQADLEKQKKKS